MCPVRGHCLSLFLFRIFYNDVMGGIPDNLENNELLKLSFDEDDRTSYGSMRILVRNPELYRGSVYDDKNYLIDRVLAESHKGKCRLLLTMLLRHGLEESKLRTDFLNYCMDGIVNGAYPCSVRVLCIKLACGQCRFYPELTEELKSVLHLLDIGNVSPGLAAARRNVLKKIE